MDEKEMKVIAEKIGIWVGLVAFVWFVLILGLVLTAAAVRWLS